MIKANKLFNPQNIRIGAQNEIENELQMLYLFFLVWKDNLKHLKWEENN